MLWYCFSFDLILVKTLSPFCRAFVCVLALIEKISAHKCLFSFFFVDIVLTEPTELKVVICTC